jgi:hypothetical protein
LEIWKYRLTKLFYLNITQNIGLNSQLWCKIYFKVLLKSFFGVSVLYFTIYIFDNFYFYFTTFLKKLMYFLLHTFSLTTKSTFFMASRTGKWSNSRTYQENTPGHRYCLWSGRLTKHKCLVCKLCVGVCPWLSVNR